MNSHQIIINSVACDIEPMSSKVGIFHRQYSHPEVTRTPVFYEEASAQDKKGVDYDHVGRVDMSQIKNEAVLPDADYYICGPQPLMKAQSRSLESLGVSPDRIHMEVFGSPSD